MILPDYQGGSIVNLMASIGEALGIDPSPHPPLRNLSPATLRESKNLVLLVLDGLGFNTLNHIGSGGALHQHLRGPITSVFPSTTATAVTTFLTGLAPQQHALTGWHTYFREIGTIAAVLPFRPRHGGPPLSEAGYSPGALLGHQAFTERIQRLSYTVAPQRIIHSDYNLTFSAGSHRRGYSSLQEMFSEMEVILRENHEPKFIYAYYPEIDAIGHDHGIGSHKVAAHFNQLDKAFDRFLSAIQSTDTTLIVTADHGQIDSNPSRTIELEQHPALAETLVLPLCGERRAAYCYVHPGKVAQFESYVLNEFAHCADLFRSADLIDQGYFGLGAPHPRLWERIGDYTLMMKENYTIKDWLLGERRHVHIGVHGGVSEGEMVVPLIVAGD